VPTHEPIDAGTLLINNTTGSGTGLGLVQVNGGILGGDGIIGGAVTVGTGQSSEAVIGPGGDNVVPGTLTIQKKLTPKSDASYRVLFNSDTAAADKLIAGGLRIRGAQIVLRDSGSTVLAPGTVFTVIDNTAAIIISGNFSNLADGETVTVSSNIFQANYEGGDGNDLTLTVVP